MRMIGIHDNSLSKYPDTPGSTNITNSALYLTNMINNFNVVFNDNYTLVYEILVDEIRRLISRSYTFAILSDMIMNSPHGNQMDNVKLTVKPEIIEGITRKKFKEYFGCF